MNTASHELCKELYELSGWWDDRLDKYDKQAPEFGIVRWGALPAYDLGYLLRKLPSRIIASDDKLYYLGIETTDSDDYIACYGVTTSRGHKEAPNIGNFIAIEPEDAAAKLAIELFKQGVLKKEVDHE